MKSFTFQAPPTFFRDGASHKIADLVRDWRARVPLVTDGACAMPA